MARAAEPRRTVPLKIQRDVALAQLAEALTKLGLIPVDMPVRWELDHDPALVLRPTDATGQHIPHQHDPRGLVWMTKEAHDRKTNGRGGERRVTTLGSDKHVAAKIERLSEAEAEARRRMLSPEAREEQPRSRLQGRPLPKSAPQCRASKPLSKSCNAPIR